MFTLPDLPYAYEALEPFVDKETMLVHHTKHHQTYTDKLNAALEKHPELFERDAADLIRNLETLPEDIRAAVRNNGGGYLNHNLFWESLIPAAESETVADPLKAAIERDFGSLADMVKELKEKTAAHFGSGWGWLALNQGGKLEILTTANQDSPLSQGLEPLLGLDVWEHAYYLKYQNRRVEYLDALMNVVNWKVINQRFEAKS